MKETKAASELASLRAAVLEDLMTTSDAQLRQEAADDGEDLDAVAMQIRTTMREASAVALRQRLVQAKQRTRTVPDPQVSPQVRPSVEAIKKLIQGLFQTDTSLGLAFRDGKKQTDADWQTLYDDLVDIGAIKPDDHGR